MTIKLNWGAFFTTLAAAFQGKLTAPKPTTPLTFDQAIVALQILSDTATANAAKIRKIAVDLDDVALALAAMGVPYAETAAEILSPPEIQTALAAIPTLRKWLGFLQEFQADPTSPADPANREYRGR